MPQGLKRPHKQKDPAFLVPMPNELSNKSRFQKSFSVGTASFYATHYTLKTRNLCTIDSIPSSVYRNYQDPCGLTWSLGSGPHTA